MFLLEFLHEFSLYYRYHFMHRRRRRRFYYFATGQDDDTYGYGLLMHDRCVDKGLQDMVYGFVSVNHVMDVWYTRVKWL